MCVGMVVGFRCFRRVGEGWQGVWNVSIFLTCHGLFSCVGNVGRAYEVCLLFWCAMGFFHVWGRGGRVYEVCLFFWCAMGFFHVWGGVAGFMKCVYFSDVPWAFFMCGGRGGRVYEVCLLFWCAIGFFHVWERGGRVYEVCLLFRCAMGFFHVWERGGRVYEVCLLFWCAVGFFHVWGRGEGWQGLWSVSTFLMCRGLFSCVGEGWQGVWSVSTFLMCRGLFSCVGRGGRVQKEYLPFSCVGEGWQALGREYPGRWSRSPGRRCWTVGWSLATAAANTRDTATCSAVTMQQQHAQINIANGHPSTATAGRFPIKTNKLLYCGYEIISISLFHQEWS